MSDEFLYRMQHHVARLSVGPSAARGQGSPGLVSAARSHLAALSLRQFGEAGHRSFTATLDRETTALERALPRKGSSWGMARKLLNIFLRNAFYTSYLRDAFRLERAEHRYESPLDSVMAKELLSPRGRSKLPRWPGVRHLTRDVSDAYQKEGCRRARELEIAPVHLDAYWWGGPRS